MFTFGSCNHHNLQFESSFDQADVEIPGLLIVRSNIGDLGIATVDLGQAVESLQRVMGKESYFAQSLGQIILTIEDVQLLLVVA